MALDQIILVSNPGSTSRKYSLYKGTKLLVSFYFEFIGKKLFVSSSKDAHEQVVNISHPVFAPTLLPGLINEALPDFDQDSIRIISLRIVAPSSFFQRDHVLNKGVIKRLEKYNEIAPLHIQATMSEYALLQKNFPKAKFVGVSDSAFLAKKPDHAMYYGIPFKDANKYDIKRFGYHGLSLESVVTILKQTKLLQKRVVICHLGGGATVAAVKNGTVVDSTMGFSPLEGVLMASRSGSMDVMAFETIRTKLKLHSDKIYDYFNARSGLLGVSGVSSDIRELLKLESKEPGAKRALDMYVYKIQQAIGSMAAAMNGVDEVIFTGTVGERSEEIRKRISANLLYLGFILDYKRNQAGLTGHSKASVITKRTQPGRLLIVHTDESLQMAKHASSLLK